MIATFRPFSKDFKRAIGEADDLYRLIPKHPAENLAYRKWVLHEAQHDDEFAKALWIACKRDILFWINTFCMMKESREGLGTQGEAKIFPWITWPVQDWLLTEMDKSCGKENVVLAKPRAAAASWCVIALFFYYCNFRHDVDFGVSSAKEDKVDAKDDPSSLFGKIDVLLRYMPKFLLPSETYVRGPARYVNHETHSTIMGYASTGDLNTGGRNTAFLMDEFGDFPANRDYEAFETMYAGVTNSIFMVSTYSKRRGCCFNKKSKDAKFPAKRLKISWQDCPPQAAGMYVRKAGGAVELLDKNPPPIVKAVFEGGEPRDVRFPEEYPFIDDGAVRSPYYDLKSRGLTKQERARQLEADEEGSALPGLNRDLVRALKESHAKPPLHRGTIAFDAEDYRLRFISDPAGPLLLWCPLVDEMEGDRKTGYKLPAIGDDAVSLGVDLSAGVSASNTVIDIRSRSDGRQLGAYITAHEDPKKAARITKALGLWLHGCEEQALVNFDAIGPTGAMFRNEIKRIGYWNFYRREVKDEMRDEKTKKIGYGISPDGPGDILIEMIDAVARGDADIFDEFCYDEFCEYELVDGKYVHGGAARSEDESESLKTHGDRAVAAALSWIGCQYRSHKKAVAEVKREYPYGSSEWIENYLSELERATQADDLFNFADVA